MKKIFTIIAAMLLTIAVNATSVILGTEGSPKATHANAISAVISSYDTIFLRAGIYTETRLAFTTGTKVIKAISDTAVIKATKNNTIAGASTKVTFDGIFFDGSTNSSYRGFTVEDASAGKEYRFNRCEFYSYSKNVIACEDATYTIDSVIVTNCYFHNHSRGSIYFKSSTVENQETCYGLIVKNSTFANIDASGDWVSIIDFESKGNESAENVELLVDHCTFYNNLTINSDHASIRSYQAKKTNVTNCIFAHSSSYERRATYLIANPSYAKNCIAYNFTVDTEHDGHTWMTNRTNCSMQDPKFKDVTKGFQLKGDYVNDDVSPARGAATDGTDLGDPRWYTPGTYPSTDFSGDGYVLAAANATLTNSDDNFKVVTPEAPDKPYIYYNNKDYFGTASWGFTATRAALVEVILNLGTYGGTSHKHNFDVKLYTEAGVLVDTIAEGRAYNDADESNDENMDKSLSGYLYVPAAGNYTIKLLNNRKWSKTVLYGVTLKYIDAPMPMYLKFGEGYAWDVAGAKFCAYSFEDGKDPYTSDFMELAENETAIYKTVVPANYAKVIFIRNANTATKPGFDDKWNQTSNITREANKDFFIINGGSDQNYTGYWKKYNSALEDAYYLIGIVNGVEGWNEEDLTAARKFTADASAEVEDQMSVEAKLVSSDRIKAVYVEKKEIKYWYPNSGEGWIIDGNHTGDPQTVYLSPGGHGGTGWLNTVLFVPDNTATSIDETTVGEKAVKVIRNGQLFIEKDGKTYNVLGTVVK